MCPSGKYTIWFSNGERLPNQAWDDEGGAAGGGAGSFLNNSRGQFQLQFPQLPPAEKFILQLEQYAQMAPSDTNADGTTGAILKTFSPSVPPAAAGWVIGASPPNTETVGLLYIKGFSTQSGWNMVESYKPPGSSEILLSAIDFSGISANGESGNATSKQPQTNQYVIDRPSQNGIYELYLLGINGDYLAARVGAAGAVANHLMGDYICGISLTPMTSEQIKNWDCRP